MSTNSTTIRISKDTWARLESRKEGKSHNSLVNELLDGHTKGLTKAEIQDMIDVTISDKERY